MVTTPNPPTSTSFRFAELPGALVVSHPSTQRAQWQPLRPRETPTVQQLRDPGGDSSWYTWILLQESSTDGQIDQRRKSRWNLFFGFLLLTAVFFFSEAGNKHRTAGVIKTIWQTMKIGKIISQNAVSQQPRWIQILFFSAFHHCHVSIDSPGLPNSAVGEVAFRVLKVAGGPGF